MMQKRVYFREKRGCFAVPAKHVKHYMNQRSYQRISRKSYRLEIGALS